MMTEPPMTVLRQLAHGSRLFLYNDFLGIVDLVLYDSDEEPIYYCQGAAVHHQELTTGQVTHGARHHAT